MELTGWLGVLGLAQPPERLLPAQHRVVGVGAVVGETQLNAGVVDSLCRSWYRPLAGSKRLATCAELQSPDWRTDSNHGNG